ncbi:MAG TPA: TolC family protein [Candidatus Krumholzibacteria bacterium]|nr:TolC family protein [Candidatus Krumholzibacteria bacterium]
MGSARSARSSRGLQGFVAAAAVAVALAAALARPGVAQAPAPAPSPAPLRLPLGANPDSALAAEIAKIPGTALALEEAVQAALEQDTAIVEAEAVLRAAQGVVRREKGPFDPEVFARYDVDDQEIPASSPLAGAQVLETNERATSVGARKRFGSTGTEIEAAVDSRRLDTNSGFETLIPKYVAEGRLSLTQPLLKGFGPSARAELSAAERDLEAAQSQYESTVLAVRSTVEQFYWDLYAAERDVAVERLIRDRGARLLEDTRVRARSGLVGPDDVANAQVFLAQEEQAVLDREERLGAVSDRLATLMGRRPEPGMSRFRPTQGPPLAFAEAPVDSVVQLALSHNHDLQVVERRIESVRALERGARWDALPDLQLVGSLGGNGLAGTPHPVVFPGSVDTLSATVRGDAGEAWSQVFSRDFPTWTLGLRLSVPLGLREGRGERDRLRAEAERAENQLTAVRRGLEEDVRNRHRELSNAPRRVQAARTGVEAAIEQTRIGILEYESGRTTAFELVRLAADVATAQQRYSEALVRAAKAAAELRLLTAGTFPPP